MDSLTARTDISSPKEAVEEHGSVEGRLSHDQDCDPRQRSSARGAPRSSGGLSPYEPPPLIGARKGRRNLFVPQGSSAGSFEEALSLRRELPSALRAIASTCVMVTRHRGGTGRPMSPADFDSILLRELLPVRRPPAYTDMGHFTGKHATHDAFGPFAVWFESLLELDHLREIEWEGVDELNTQVIQLRWTLPSGRCLYHYPDIVFRAGDHTVLVDVSTRSRLTEERCLAFDLTALSCGRWGWAFEIATDELSTTRRRNLRYIAAGRDNGELAPPRWDAKSRPQTMWGLVLAEGGGAAGWQNAVSRLWRREIGMDLDALLDDTTVLIDAPAASPRRRWAVS